MSSVDPFLAEITRVALAVGLGAGAARGRVHQAVGT